MKINGIKCSIVAALVFAASSSYGQNLNPYVQLNAGVAYGLAPKGDFNKKAMKKSGVYSVEVGSKLHDNFRAGLSVDYRNNFTHKYNASYVEDGVNHNESSRIKVKSLAVMANFYYDLAKIGTFTPYLTAGMGVALNKAGEHVTVADYGYHSVDGKGSKTNFAFKVGAGTKFAINDRLEFDLRYQFADLGKFQTGYSHKDYLNGTLVRQITSEKAKGRLKSHEIMAGLTYKF